MRMAEVAKALGDPIRLQLVDVLRKHAGKVCVCDLVPLFDICQPTLSHHLKKLREAGIDDSPARLGGRRFVGIEIRETHRVHRHAAAAIIRARKPAA
jgi:DNA-binding transcriptional ArsR family regulator